LTNVAAITGGYDHNMAITSQGTVAAWGSNLMGQTNVPAMASNVVAIAAGKDDSLALSGAVLPALTATYPAVSQGKFSVLVPTARGRNYRLEFKTALTDQKWTLVTPVPGDGTTKTLTDAGASAPKRYYRVRQ
jgi:hypothetical protein